MKGIDVSSYQGNPDWAKVRAAGIDFTYVKASEGVGAPAKGFSQQASGAWGAGIPHVGFYHFATLNKPDAVEMDAKSEAVYFAGLIHDRGNMLPVLDIEANPGHLNPLQVTDYIIAFIAQMKLLGYPETVIYSYAPFLDENLPTGHPFGGNKLWLAQYTTGGSPRHLPKGWNTWWCWQYTSKGVVDGIVGDVDMNIMPQI